GRRGGGAARARAGAALGGGAPRGEPAGVAAGRLGGGEDRRRVREEALAEARRAVRCLELRMPPAQGLLRVALATRPALVLLAAEGSDGRAPSGPVDLRGRPQPIHAAVRALAEARIPVGAVVAPDLETVKHAHGAGVSRVELYTGAIVDLPGAERQAAPQRLGAAARPGRGVRLGVGIGGGIGYRSAGELLAACPALEWVAVGRAAVARAMLVGMDRAVRDLRDLVG